MQGSEPPLVWVKLTFRFRLDSGNKKTNKQTRNRFLEKSFKDLVIYGAHHGLRWRVSTKQQTHIRWPSNKVMNWDVLFPRRVSPTLTDKFVPTQQRPSQLGALNMPCSSATPALAGNPTRHFFNMLHHTNASPTICCVFCCVMWIFI